MKKFILTVSAFLLLITPCFGDGTTVAVPTPIRAMDGTMGWNVTITATADASSGAFLPILFNQTTNKGAYTDMLGSWLTSMRTVIPSAITAPTASYDIYMLDSATATGEYVLTTPALSVGVAAADDVTTGAFNFIINGVSYAKAAAETGPGNDVIPQNTYGAVALDIGANGTIDAIEAAANATGYASAVLAIAGVPAAASDHCRLGYVTAMKSDGAFTFGTTELSAANVTEAYTSTIPIFDILGGRGVDRSATVSEEVYPANTAGDNAYKFIKGPIMVVPVNNSVNSAVISIELIFN